MSRSLISVLLIAFSTQGCAHRTLTIVDQEGRGLGGVDVHAQPRAGEAWRAVGETDESGAVRVRVGRGSVRLVSLGHETKVLGLGDPGGLGPVVLREQALLIPELTLRSPRLVCASADDPLARGFWDRASEPLRGPWDTVGLAAFGSFHGGGVSFEDRARRPADTDSAWVMALRGSHSIEDRIREYGYAWRLGPGLRGIWEGQDFGYWYYPRFGLFNAHHLTSRLFGELNRFVLLHQDGDEVQIGFCGRDQARPFVLGVLTLRGGEIVHALWRFSTPDPVEDAGGEATFQPNPHAAILTPAVSVYWRSRGIETQYLQRRFLVIHEYLLEHQLRARGAQRPGS
jgi:hypothetical protein